VGNLKAMPAAYKKANADDNGHGTHIAGIIGAVSRHISWLYSIMGPFHLLVTVLWWRRAVRGTHGKWETRENSRQQRERAGSHSEVSGAAGQQSDSRIWLVVLVNARRRRWRRSARAGWSHGRTAFMKLRPRL
jgi:subtilisin family serine protease